MFCSRFFKTFALAVFLAATCGYASDWRINAGIGIRNQTPIVAIAGFGYKEAILRVQGMGYYKEENEYWCGIRGSLLWTFFRGMPFNLEAGIGGGYEYARAPNKMYQAISKANEDMYMLGHDYKEIGDISVELWTRLYGFYTQISVPTRKFVEHDAKKLLWGTGYIFEF